MQISTVKAPDLVKKVLRAGLVPMLLSSPGIGKSSIAHQIAKDLNLKVIDVRLSQADPADLLGFPSINADRTKAGYVPMDMFPIEGDKVPEGYKGWIVLMDEFNSAPLSVQAAAYKIVLDRQVGMHNLHPKVGIIAAGNLATDRAIVNRLSTAMQSRIIHFELGLDNKGWMDWADDNDVDFRVKAFINFKPELLQDFKPDHNDVTFACPRTWEFVSKIIKQMPKLDIDDLPLLTGAVSEGAGREFFGFCEIFESLPTIQTILANPEGVNIPDNEPSICYAISGLVAKHFEASTADKLMKLINRLPIEFQVICLRSGLKTDKTMVTLPPVRAWISKNSQELL